MKKQLISHQNLWDKLKRIKVFCILISMSQIGLTQGTFEFVEHTNMYISDGGGICQDEDGYYYAIGHGNDTLGYSQQGIYIAKFKEDGTLVYKNYHEKYGVIHFANLSNDVYLVNEEVVFGITSTGINCFGSVIFANKDNGTINDEICIESESEFTLALMDLDFIEKDSSFVIYTRTLDTLTMDNNYQISFIKNKAISNSLQFGYPYIDDFPSSFEVKDSIVYMNILHQFGTDFDSSFSENQLVASDLNGNILWEREPNNSAQIDTSEILASSIIVDDSHNLIIATHEYIKYEAPFGNGVLYPMLEKRNRNGEVLWQRKMGLGGYSSQFNLAQEVIFSHDKDGYIVVGAVSDLDNRYINPSNSYEFPGFMAKVSNEGDSLWMRTFSIYENEGAIHSFRDVIQTIDDGYALYGQMWQSFELPEGATSPNQSYFVKVDQYGCLVPDCHIADTISNVIYNIEEEIKVYPNPAFDKLHIYKPGDEKADIFVFDNCGKNLITTKSNFGNETISINIESWMPGIYFIKVVNRKTNKFKIEKIIID